MQSFVCRFASIYQSQENVPLFKTFCIERMIFFRVIFGKKVVFQELPMGSSTHVLMMLSMTSQSGDCVRFVQFIYSFPGSRVSLTAVSFTIKTCNNKTELFNPHKIIPIYQYACIIVICLCTIIIVCFLGALWFSATSRRPQSSR